MEPAAKHSQGGHTSMKTRSSNRSKKVLALAFSFGLVAAACGSDDDGGEAEPPAETEAEAKSLCDSAAKLL